MPWFRVDDGFHSHPKALAASPAALGLWVLAGSWCMDSLTDGFIADDCLNRILPRSRKLADELVKVGLWERARKNGKQGFRFHDWKLKQPSRKAVENEREANRRRQAAWRHGARNAVTNGVSARAPTQPITTTDEASTTGRQPRKLPNHNFDEFKINGVVATRQPPPFAEAVRDALNPERKP